MWLSVSLKAVVYFDLFQSTLPRRERLCDCVVCPVRINFNPRSREGSDRYCLRSRPVHYYFSPRSREGSDLKDVNYPWAGSTFQSALP